MYVHANGLRAQFMYVHANCLRKLFLGVIDARVNSIHW